MSVNVRENAFANEGLKLNCMQFINFEAIRFREDDQKLSIFHTNQFVTIFGRKRNRRRKYLGMTHEKKINKNNVVELFCRFECLTIFRYYQSEIIFGNDNFKQI